MFSTAELEDLGAVDARLLLQLCLGDPGIVAVATVVFTREAPHLLRALEEAVNDRDRKAATWAARTLKGSLMGIAAAPAAARAAFLERLIKDEQRTDPVEPHLEALRAAVPRITTRLQAIAQAARS